MTEDKLPKKLPDLSDLGVESKESGEKAVPGVDSSAPPIGRAKKSPIKQEKGKAAVEKAAVIDDSKSQLKNRKQIKNTATKNSDKNFKTYNELFNKKKDKKKVIAIGSSGALAIALIAGIIAFDPFSGFNKEDSETVYENVTANEVIPDDLQEFLDKEAEIITETERIDALLEDKFFPVSLREWELQSKDLLDIEKDGKDLINDSIKAGVFGTASILPSKTNGFTSNEEDVKLEDGTINPLYSFITVEDFAIESEIILKTFLNPVFGGWANYQFKDQIEDIEGLAYNFNEIFSPIYLSKVSSEEMKARDWLPILADWDLDDYGLSDHLLPRDSRWVGVPKKIETNVDNTDGAYIFNIKADVDYYAWTIGEQVINKKGTIELELTPNVGDHKNGYDNKVVITDSKLTITE